MSRSEIISKTFRICDALHLAFTIYSVYYYLVVNYANLGALTEIVWSLRIQLVINVLIIPTVHFLYVHRIWKGDYFPTVKWLHLLNKTSEQGPVKSSPSHSIVHSRGLSAGVGIPLVWAQYQVNSFQGLIGIEWSTYLALGAATFVDMLIASTLCYLLALHVPGSLVAQHRFIPDKTHVLYHQYRLFDKYMFLVNYNHSEVISIVLSTFEISESCLQCAVLPTTFVFIGLQFLVTKLYVNSFIAFLNARYYIQVNPTVDSPQIYERHGIYHPELRIGASQDEECQKPREVPEDEVMHITQPFKLPCRWYR
ncbi:hypothetical protein BDR07DRAFT_1496594 [Suillus spraguei]|nr:hypothetical protein BDR07DRAFT_1496594 [Suillus spraguei]